MLSYNNNLENEDLGKFLCRKSIVWSIFSDIVSLGNSSIYGLPLIGKTYVLQCLSSSDIQQQFKLETGQDLSHCIFVYINLEAFLQKSFESFFESLSRYIVKGSEKRLLLTYDAEMGADSFTDILDQICEKELHLILLMDMFDEIVLNEQIYPILGFLRAHATMHKVSYITASIASLYDLCHHKIADSPFFNIFRNYHLEAISTEEALELSKVLTQRAGKDLEDPAVKQILLYAGRHPFFIQHICSVFLKENLNVDNYKEEQLIKHKAYDDILQHFHYVWDRLSEDQRTLLQDEAQQEDNHSRDLPELSESALFRRFVRKLMHSNRRLQVFKMTPEELEHALDSIDDATKLGSTNLRLLGLVSQRLRKDISPTTVEKGMAIRSILNEAFERLRGSVVRSDSDPTLLNYNILYYRYFKYHLKNEQIAARIGFSERQYFRYRTRAIEALLNILFEMENGYNSDE